MNYLLLCDYRENLKNYSLDDKIYNDHPTSQNIQEILKAINSQGYSCNYFGGIPELINAIEQKKKFDNSVFLNFTDGMDQNYSRAQAPLLLDILNVPYSGSDVFSSVLMNNKHFCKMALRELNILMPKSCLINDHLPLKETYIKGWRYPLFAKPNCEGSSVGITAQNVCHSFQDVLKITGKLLKEFNEIILEEFIPGLDITNYLIGNPGRYYINDIVVAELFDHSPYAIYGLDEKHNKKRTLYYNNEFLPSELITTICAQSEKTAALLGAKDICRIDYRLDIASHKFYFIEINSAPRFSSTSEIGFIAQKRGLGFEDVVNFLLESVNRRLSIIN